MLDHYLLHPETWNSKFLQWLLPSNDGRHHHSYYNHHHHHHDDNMTDVFSPASMDYSDNRFQFLSTSSKMSEDSFGDMSPLSPAMRDDRLTPRNGHSCCTMGSVSSYGQFSVTSDASSVNSVFIRNKPSNGDLPGNDYSRDPSTRKGSCPSNIGTANNGKGVSRLYPTKSGHDESSPSRKGGHLKSHAKTHEVTYTITDAAEDGGNQVVVLPPPPPHEPDSDNESITGCELGGPCSPRHHDWRESRDFGGKSPTSRGGHGSNRMCCMCCMLLVFILSTAGLATVLVLVYLGNLQLASIPNVRAYGSQGRARLGEGALVREVCETGACLKTSSSILSRMNTTAKPCDDFYAYACGGFSKEADLSWFRTRVREFPDEIIKEHRKYIIDRLSDSFDPSDGKMMTTAKTIFRSCLFRSKTPDTNLKNLVSEIFESLGGLSPLTTDTTDLTHLLANVTRMFGASPFFKVVVHAPKKISIISQLSEHRDPWEAKREMSRQKSSTTRESTKRNMARLTELLVSLINGSVTTSEARGIVSRFFRLEGDIKRILGSGQSRVGSYKSDTDIVCDAPGRKRTVGDVQTMYNKFGIDWFLLLQNIVDLTDVSDIELCKVRLSLNLQHLLEITPKSTIRQFILIHTLLHSKLRLLYANDFDSVLHPDTSPSSPPSPQTGEEQCLGVLLYFVPSLEKFADCDRQTLESNRRDIYTTIRYVRASLKSILTDTLRLPEVSADIITNAAAEARIDSIKSQMDSASCRPASGPQGSFSEYNFTGNMLRVIQHHYNDYYLGRLQRPFEDAELAAFWISASAVANHRARSGPVLYKSAAPTPVFFGSLGTFLASKVADGLSIEALLDHHSEGLLNHSVVLGLAVKLRCFVEMYAGMEIAHYGSVVYTADGKNTKGQQWKDQLALKMAYKAWRNAEESLTTDHFIPGLTYPRPQLFFLSYAQTMCEKTNSRGIMEHYVSDYAHPAIPSHQRVNGILRSSDEFSRAFQCSKGSYMNPSDKCKILS